MEPIAIIGLGCRFPGGDSPEAFWQMLRDGMDAISEVSPDRWPVEAFYAPEPATQGKMNSRWGGFLNQVGHFDPDFFDISEAEAEEMDPQQRLLLEVIWEALEDSGLAPEQLAGSNTGVFVGLGNFDYHRLIFKDPEKLTPFSATGGFSSVAANRISFLLDLHGPSLVVDTACSSSLVALHLACQSLRLQESDLCFLGGVNLVLSPEPTVAYAQSGLIAGDGRCKTFDASADGYVRGEGCGVLLLKRLSDAQKNQDNIRAVIKGSAVNQDGLSHGLTAPNGLAQEALIRQALKNAEVSPAHLSYVETHGTGTLLGDAVEVEALKAVLRQERSPHPPCWIGSVKTNIGHLDAASGMASLIKVILALQHQLIPPHLHLKQLSHYFSLDGTPLSVPTTVQPWPAGGEPRFAGVSTFGFGGTNAHAILEEAPPPPVIVNPVERPLHLLTLRAKTEKALQELASRYQSFVSRYPTLSLPDLCYTANTGRLNANYRLAVVAASTEELAEKLGDFVRGEATNGVVSGRIKGRKRPKLVFVFPAELALPRNWQGTLYGSYPQFRETLERCDEIWQSLGGDSVLFSLFSDSLENVAIAHFFWQYALAQLWLSWGIKPSAVMGAGMGEYVAACVAQIFSLEEALRLIAVKKAIAQPVEAITLSVPKIGFISSRTGHLEQETVTTLDYWQSPSSEPTKWQEGHQTLIEKGYQLCVEIGIESKLEEIRATSLTKKREKSQLSYTQDDWTRIFLDLGKLYVWGLPVNWRSFDSPYQRQRCSLPTYPFQRQYYWLATSKAERSEGGQ